MIKHHSSPISLQRANIQVIMTVNPLLTAPLVTAHAHQLAQALVTVTRTVVAVVNHMN